MITDFISTAMKTKIDDFDFFELNNMFSETTFMASIIDSNVTVQRDGISCERLLFTGNYHGLKFPITFKHNFGKIKRDLLETGTGFLYLISDKIKNLLECNNLTGWNLFSINLLDKNENEIVGYHGFSVTGRCGPLDYNKGEIIQRQFFEGGPFRKYRKGFQFDLGQWDGSDFFLPNGSLRIIVTAKVASIFKKNKISNVCFENIKNVEISEIDIQMLENQ